MEPFPWGLTRLDQMAGPEGMAGGTRFAVWYHPRLTRS